MTSFVKKQIKNHDDIPAVKQFLTYIESLQYTGNIEKSTQEVINSLTGSISLDALQSVADSVNETMMFINETMKFLQEQIKIVVSINVQKDSETYNRRTEFLKRYEKVLEHVNNKVLEYSECVKSCKFLSGHTEVVAE